MAEYTEISEEKLKIIPDSIQYQLGLSVGDRIKWKVFDDNSAIVERAKPNESDNSVSRRVVLKDIGISFIGGLATGIVGSGAATAMEVDEALEPYLPNFVDESIYSRLLWFTGDIFVTPGRGAPEISDLGEIDFLTQVELANAVLKTVDDVEPQSVNELDVNKAGHIATTTGPLGSEFVALSMGYDPDSIAEYQGRLPYIFDLAPSEKYYGMSLDEIRSERTNWPITKSYGDPTSIEPEKRDGEPTLGDSNRPKYRIDYGMAVVKKLHEGWEQYEKYEDYSPLTEYDNNIHLLVAGCHGEGTLAVAKALSDEEMIREIEQKIPSDVNRYQAVFTAYIDHYDEREDRRGDTVYVPEFQNISLYDAKPL
ncbi:hypothetical protein J2744_001460 [Halorubrum trapanicum]|uniref:Uncharacterized protein n=1 Tax=Halorubrum trapanicum TaxID=29284 RepID=A0A8J7RR47_9EURY|nr:hypothetical protein [Halorubrum trapanicum]MBP1901782.1 hypothetical protein [Halorubrum trapanicum]